jgi:septum site-determining protein MinC
MGDTVTIKGTSEGLVIHLGPGPLSAVIDEMEACLSTKASFFVGGRVALQVGDRALSIEQLQTIGVKLEKFGVTLWAIDGQHPTTRAAAQELGLESNLYPSVYSSPGAAEQDEWEESFGIVVRRTLRSGQMIRYAGHVALIGDVNPGAEIVAGGDIIVWGKLKGYVHAGAVGDDTAVVCALELAPSQIRIGSRIARPPERGRPPKVPEIASVQEDGIVVERWNKTSRSFDLGSLRRSHKSPSSGGDA